VREVRVIDDEGNQLGIMTPFDAIKKAKEKNLDLVEVFALRCASRLPDHGFRQVHLPDGKTRSAKRKESEVIVVKEVKFRINVDDHDYDTKKNHVLRFLEEGDKVKATIFFRGREMTRQMLGVKILERLIVDVATMESWNPAPAGRNTLHLILAPKKAATQEKKPKAPKPAQPQQAKPPQQQPATPPAAANPPARVSFTRDCSIGLSHKESSRRNFVCRGLMPKLKTHKGAAKRFKKTGTGKVKRASSFLRHILTRRTRSGSGICAALRS